MNKTFITIIAVTTLLVTSLNARTAEASDSDIAKLLFGATTLIILGAAINDHQDDKKDNKPRHYSKPPKHQHYAPKPKPKPTAGHARIPARCEREYRQHNGGTHTGYSQECLDYYFRSARPLPQECKRNIHSRKYGRVKTYSASCMQRHGYKVAYKH
ncbi:MAG: hypothetical protein ABJO27_27280 [Pseudoruegeria sp.]